jgi:hypothetical protein
MENKEIVLNELKGLYDDGYIFGDIAHFHDMLTYEHPDTEVGRAYNKLSRDEEIEVLEEYVRYRKNERANLRVRKDYKEY